MSDTKSAPSAAGELNAPGKQPTPAEHAIRMLLELGPLLIYWATFVFVNRSLGEHKAILIGTSVFVLATLASLVVSKILHGKIAVVPLVSGVFVLIFGGLTVYLQNDTFIKIKPTIVNLLFAAILLGGYLLDRPLLNYLFGAAFQIDAEGWRKLTLRWGLFFLVLAGLNEIVWRNFSTANWILFKAWGILPLTLIFAMSQVGLILRHQIQPEIASSAESPKHPGKF
jgi:intracellular septation protein